MSPVSNKTIRDSYPRTGRYTNLVTFDLDGTLADSVAFDGELYVEAVRSVLGVDINEQG